MTFDMVYMSINDVVNSEKYPFKKGQMRQFLLERKANGLEKAVRKIGKRLYLRSDLLDEWIELHMEININEGEKHGTE